MTSIPFDTESEKTDTSIAVPQVDAEEAEVPFYLDPQYGDTIRRASAQATPTHHIDPERAEAAYMTTYALIDAAYAIAEVTRKAHAATNAMACVVAEKAARRTLAHYHPPVFSLRDGEGTVLSGEQVWWQTAICRSMYDAADAAAEEYLATAFYATLGQHRFGDCSTWKNALVDADATEVVRFLAQELMSMRGIHHAAACRAVAVVGIEAAARESTKESQSTAVDTSSREDSPTGTAPEDRQEVKARFSDTPDPDGEDEE